MATITKQGNVYKVGNQSFSNEASAKQAAARLDKAQNRKASDPTVTKQKVTIGNTTYTADELSKISKDKNKAIEIKNRMDAEGFTAKGKYTPPKGTPTMEGTYNTEVQKNYDIEKVGNMYRFKSKDPNYTQSGGYKYFGNLSDATRAIDEGNKTTGSFSKYGQEPAEDIGKGTFPQYSDYYKSVEEVQKVGQGQQDALQKFQDDWKLATSKNISNLETAQGAANTGLEANIEDRFNNISNAKDEMNGYLDEIKKGNERIIQYQSNENLDMLKNKLRNMGLSDTEIENQARSLIDKQIQTEQRAIDENNIKVAELKKNVAERGANANDLVLQAEASNIKLKPEYVSAITNLNNALEQTYTTNKANIYEKYISDIALKGAQGISDLQLQKLGQAMGVDLANTNKEYGLQQLLSQASSYLDKVSPGTLQAILDDYSAGRISYGQAISKIVGSAVGKKSGGATTTTNASTTNKQTSQTSSNFDRGAYIEDMAKMMAAMGI